MLGFHYWILFYSNLYMKTQPEFQILKRSRKGGDLSNRKVTWKGSSHCSFRRLRIQVLFISYSVSYCSASQLSSWLRTPEAISFLVSGNFRTCYTFSPRASAALDFFFFPDKMLFHYLKKSPVMASWFSCNTIFFRSRIWMCYWYICRASVFCCCFKSHYFYMSD